MKNPMNNPITVAVFFMGLLGLAWSLFLLVERGLDNSPTALILGSAILLGSAAIAVAIQYRDKGGSGPK